MKIRKAVIPAGGFGTRFLPATKAVPKEMLPIVDTPTIQYIVREAVGSGIEDIIIVTGRSKRAIEDHFDRSAELEDLLEKKHKRRLLEEMRGINHMANMIYVRQQEALGLGHAVLTAKPAVGDEPFAVLLGDDVVEGKRPALAQLLHVYEERKGCVVGVQRVAHEETRKYGVIRGRQLEDRVYEVAGLVEKPDPDEAPTDLAVLGRYVLTPEIFDVLEHTERGVGGEIQLTDALNEMAGRAPLHACEFEGRRYDIGDKLGFLQATCEFALRNTELRAPFAAYLQKLAKDLEEEKK